MDETLKLLADQLDRAGKCIRVFPVHRHVAIDVVDEDRVEGLLPLEEWCDGLPDEGAQPSTPAGRLVGTSLEKLPAVVEWSDLVFVVRRGRVGHLPQMLHLLVERRERIVVCAVRVVAFLFQTGKIVDGEGPIEHATCVIRGRAAIWRSAAPSSGLWADV